MLRIERIEVFVTDLPDRLRRRMSSGRYDTGAGGSWIGKPVLVKTACGRFGRVGTDTPHLSGTLDAGYRLQHAPRD